MSEQLYKISELSQEEFDKMYPTEQCPKHGDYKGICMKCEKEDDAYYEAQDQKKAMFEILNDG